MEVLERVGLVVPEGNIEKVLNTIVNKIMVTTTLPANPRFAAEC